MSVSLWIRSISFNLAAVLIAGCAAAHGLPGSNWTTGEDSNRHVPGAETWMQHGTSGEDLLYATGGCGGTCVISYPGGAMVGSLDFGGNSVCADNDGHVFIAANKEIAGYAHGATTPFVTLSVPGSITLGCGIDATTHDLAVAFFGSSHYDIAIFPNETGTPTLLTAGSLEPYYCGYDDKGDLFVDGLRGYEPAKPGLAELPKGSSSFIQLSVSSKVGPTPGEVQWDGTYITYQNQGNRPRISRLKISGSNATIVSVTSLKGIKRMAEQSWISGSAVFVPYGQHQGRATNLGVWNYPEGGKHVQKIDLGNNKKLFDITGVALSRGSSRSPRRH